MKYNYIIENFSPVKLQQTKKKIPYLMKVLVMTSDGGIVYDEADDNTKDFLED